MPIAGLVLTLSDDPALRSYACETLAQDERLTLGALQRERKLPVVTDTRSLEEQQELWQTLSNTPGVLLLDLTFEDFSDVGEFASAELPSRWKQSAPSADTEKS